MILSSILLSAALSGAYLTPGAQAEITTDKALYSPGETVRFTASELPAGARVRYRKGSSALDIIDEQTLTGSEWSWTALETDYTGYLVEIVAPDGVDPKWWIY